MYVSMRGVLMSVRMLVLMLLRVDMWGFVSM